jgi:CBS domain containing-hemolysin-like protein
VNDLHWLILTITIVFDLLFSVLRASLLNTRPVQLVSLRANNAKGVEKTLLLLEKKRLRVVLRITMILIHFILSAIIGWVVLVSIPQLNPGFVFMIIVISALLIMLLEFGLEGIVLKAPERWAVRLTPVGTVLSVIVSPLAAILMGLLGSPEVLQQRLGPVTEEELKSWVTSGQAQGSLEKGEREMIYSIFQFGETLSREIMVPRIDLTALEVTSSIEEAIDVFNKSGHSRIPVYEETIDDIIGLLYAKDLLSVDPERDNIQGIRPLLRKAFFIPESKNVDELLREMQARGVHLVIVVDEYGGTAGLVTLEDIVEEIVGEIRDEYDQAEELEFQKISDDEYLFSGRIDLDDVYDILGVDLTDDVSDTLGGYIYGQIGRVPVGGEQIKVDGWVLTVQIVSGRRIRKINANRVLYETEEEEKNGH